MKLTHQNIHAAGYSGCGFNSDQLAILGIQWPPKKGWLSRLIGTDLPDADYQRLYELKGSKRRRKALKSG